MMCLILAYLGGKNRNSLGQYNTANQFYSKNVQAGNVWQGLEMLIDLKSLPDLIPDHNLAVDPFTHY